MKRNHSTKFKKGAASFYIVAFSTLILVVLAMSFAAVIISEVTRTSNDDLAQSAYDSALAGVEDAKLAYYNYQSCLESKANFDPTYKPQADSSTVTCNDIVAWVEHPDEKIENMKECDMVGHILGRIGKGESGEVFIKETQGNSDTAMKQAYTCAIINTKTNDYRTTLSGENSTRVVQVKLNTEEANDIKYVKVSWYSNSDGADYQFTNFSSNKVTFPTLATKAATPPTISLGLVQTDAIFSLAEFDDTKSGSSTNRGTVFLVPTNSTTASGNMPDNYIGAYDGTANKITAAQIIKTNDRTVKNLPYAVYCDKDKEEFACSAEIQLPSPIPHTGNPVERNKDTFMFVVSIPYGQPSTDVSLEFCNSDGCTKKETTGEGSTDISNAAELKNMQVVIDSTGRANDLYRRIEARVDTSDIYFPYPLYAIELLGEGGMNLQKNMAVTCEYQSWGDFSSTYPKCQQ